MAVIFAVVGGGAVVGIATSDPYSDYSDYSDYGDYSDYSNYSNYSDAAERRQRQIQSKQKEITYAKSDLNTFISQQIKPLLKDSTKVSIDTTSSKLDIFYKSQVENKKREEVLDKTQYIKQEIYYINTAIKRLKEIQENLGE